ncbi:hypothetical protein USDA257_c10920 [Sinorhizobium fredii USDA 257]|uniref:Uncharacterized protein n=1 Tax=Sinorhizobium fredii (strain USDA 257) TaxID=1185652 RepID=I3X1C7_SINF2|nr:hypothetical protein USDA257_c10920 [Sinorhizobium fredii USDA 257]
MQYLELAGHTGLPQEGTKTAEPRRPSASQIGSGFIGRLASYFLNACCCSAML